MLLLPLVLAVLVVVCLLVVVVGEEPLSDLLYIVTALVLRVIALLHIHEQGV